MAFGSLGTGPRYSRAYERTAGEVAAAVVPVNSYYPPGHLLRYGNNTTPGTTDMASAVQAMFDSASDTDGPLHVPPGRFRINSTISIVTKNSFLVFGSGGGRDYNGEYTTAMMQSHFLWGGAANGQMFELDNVRGATFRNLNFVGQIGAGNKADDCVKLISDTGATGGLYFEDCGFIDAVYGVTCGDIAADTNNSDIVFVRPVFRSLTSGLRVNNENGLNYEAHSPIANDVTNIFDFNEGGNLVAYNVTNRADYVLRIGSGGGGKSTGTFNFYGVRMEHDTVDPVDFLWTDSTAMSPINAIVNVHGYTASDGMPGSTHRFEIHAGVQVSVFGSRINDQNFANISGLSNAKSSLHFEDCKLDVDGTLTISDYVTEVDSDVIVTYNRLYRNDGNLFAASYGGTYPIQTGTQKLHETAAVTFTDASTWYDMANVNLAANHQSVRIRAHIDGLVNGVGYGGRVEEWTIYRRTAACVAENVGTAVDVPAAGALFSFQWVAGVDDNHMDLQAQRLSGTSTAFKVVLEAVNNSAMADNITIADGAS